MDKKQKEKHLQKLKKIEEKYPEIMDEKALLCKTNELLSILIMIFLEDAKESWRLFGIELLRKLG